MRAPGPGLRRHGAAAVLAMLLSVPVPPAAAEEPADLPARVAAASQAAAAKLVEFGSWCRGRSYRAMARAQFEEAILLDPENEAARAGLSHRKVDGAWKPPAKPVKVEDAVLRDSVAVNVVEKKALEAWGAAAAAQVELARWCEEAGHEDGARDAWNSALRIDAGNADARAALGLAGAETAWLQPRDPGPGRFAARCRGLAAKGADRLTPPSEADKYPHVACEERGYTETREARFRVRCSIPDVSSREVVGALLSMEALGEGLGLLGARRPDSPGFDYTVMASEGAYDAAVGRHPTWDEKEKERLRSYGGCWWADDAYLTWDNDGPEVLDGAAHVGSHFVFQGIFPDGAPLDWAEEGLAYVCTTTILRTALSRCAASGTSGRNAFTEQADWDAEVRTLIRKGEDPPLAEVLVAKTNDLTQERLVKARSVTAWLLSGPPAGFLKFLQACGPDRDPTVAFRRTFGAPVEAAEKRWRLWALRP